MQCNAMYLDGVGLVSFEELEVAVQCTVHLVRSSRLAPVIHGNTEGEAA